MTFKKLLSLLSATIFVAVSGVNAAPPKFDAAIPPAALPPTTTSTDTVFPTTIPVGKTLVIPVAASDPAGKPLTYSAVSSNPNIIVRVKTGNPFLNLVVSHAVSGSNDVAVSGTMQLMLFRDMTPETAGFIGGFAQGGFYNDLTFHRVDPAKGITGGRIEVTGTVSTERLVGFTFDNEFKMPLIFTGKGQLAMSNTGTETFPPYDATNGSTFYITNGLRRDIDFNNTIFGQLVRGFDTLFKISQVSRNTQNNQPISPVIITDAFVTTNNADAVLMLSATGVGTSMITVTVKNSPTVTSTNTTANRSFHVTAEKDTINDPPIILPMKDTVTPINTVASLPFQCQDLEFDKLEFSFVTGTTPATASANALGTILKVFPPSNYTGPINMAVGVMQEGAVARGSGTSPYDMTAVQIGVGDKALTPQPRTLRLKSRTVPVTLTTGAFIDADLQANATDFTGTINWGDGTPLSTGSISKDPAAGTLNRFLVSGLHAYEEPGIYPLVVTVNETVFGAMTTIASTACVTSGSISASGTSLNANSGLVSNQIVAFFNDPSSSGSSSGSYAAVIDWGDGVRTSGSVMKTSGSNNFNVLGTHQYADPTTYAINVQIKSPGETSSAWSTAKVVGLSKPSVLPPFAQAHLSSVWSNGSLSRTGSGASLQTYVSGKLLLKNTGNKPLPASAIAFYFSNDSTLSPGTTGTSQNSDTVIRFLGKATLAVPGLAPGVQTVAEFAKTPAHDWRIKLPVGNPAGKFLILQLIWTDPLADQEPIERDVVIPL